MVIKMKKILAIVLALMLAVSCSSVAFAETATPDAATPDEAVSVTSIEFTKLPDKLVYDDYDVDWDYDFSNIVDFDDLDEALLNATLTVVFDFDGAELLATYSNGETAVVSLDECNVSLVDSIRFGDIIEFETEEELIAAVYRDYTVNVEYEGVSTTYTITLEMSDFYDDYESDYVLVSFTNPDKLYYTADDIVEETWYDYDYETDEEIEETYNVIYPDVEGMTAVLMNKTTGETFIVDADSIYAEDVIVDDPDETNQTLTVYATAYIEGVEDEEGYYTDFDYVDFEFEIYYNTVADTDNKTNNNNDTEKTDTESSNNAATNDTAVSGNTDNSAVQTGQVLPSVFVLAIAIGAFAAVYFFRKRFTV